MADYYFERLEQIIYDSGDEGPEERLYFKSPEKWCVYPKGTWWFMSYAPNRSWGRFGVGHPKEPSPCATSFTFGQVLRWIKKHSHLNPYIIVDIDKKIGLTVQLNP